MKTTHNRYLIFIPILFFSLIIKAQTGSNPIFRDMFTADPAPLVYNDTLWVYCGHDEAKDGEMFTMTGWLCYSTTDMKTWKAHGEVMRPEDYKWGGQVIKDAWAAQVVHANGKFYLYTTSTYNGRAIGVAVSDKPTGPFKDARGTPLISGAPSPIKNAWDNIDPTVLIDDDGTAYLAWGNPNCYFAKLKPNMTEIDGAISIITPPNYAEGPWLSKRKDMYYLTYPAFVAPVGSEQICYATATNINGPWTYRGILTGAARNSYTIHPGIINYKGNDYLFYHFADYTINGVKGALGRRAVCVEYLCYNTDGTMKPVTQTLAGVTVPAPCPSESDPSVNITAPLNYASFVAPASFTIYADASIATGTISKVEFYNGTTKLGEDASSPYSLALTDIVVGSYSIKAVATSSTGTKSTSTAVTVKVNASQGPYNGIVHVIPGKIEFEHYDVGGNGFAYFDSEGTNTGGSSFRTDEDVDIENCSDIGDGYNIGWSTAGEWLEYTVNVATSGKYNLLLRVASNVDSRTVSMSVNGNSIATDIAIPNTTGWQIWQDVTVNDIPLEAGQQVLRLTIGASDYVNLNYMTFVAVPKDIPSIRLKAGWNFIGYPIEGSSNLDVALASIWENVEAVKNMESFYLKTNPLYLNSLTKLNWGQGYLIKVNAACELVWNVK